jgi:CBS-domain-containing membrane protein
LPIQPLEVSEQSEQPLPSSCSSQPVDSSSLQSSLSSSLQVQFYSYLQKMTGQPDKRPPPMNPPHHVLVSSTLAFCGILLIAGIDYWFLSRTFTVEDSDVAMLTGAQAATAVLLYEAFQSPLAQPRNVIGSFLISSFVGVSTRMLLCDVLNVKIWIAGAVAVSLSVFFMNLTCTLHPPGGACALIAVIGSEAIKALGYAYVLTSVCAALAMVILAVLGNNLIYDRRYPLYWY